jgi:hypothetical protein
MCIWPIEFDLIWFSLSHASQSKQFAHILWWKLVTFLFVLVFVCLFLGCSSTQHRFLRYSPFLLCGWGDKWMKCLLSFNERLPAFMQFLHLRITAPNILGRCKIAWLKTLKLITDFLIYLRFLLDYFEEGLSLARLAYKRVSPSWVLLGSNHVLSTSPPDLKHTNTSLTHKDTLSLSDTHAAWDPICDPMLPGNHSQHGRIPWGPLVSQCVRPASPDPPPTHTPRVSLLTLAVAHYSGLLCSETQTDRERKALGEKAILLPLDLFLWPVCVRLS